MKIVCDENIPFAREIFGSLGEVHLLPGREIHRTHLTEADVLIVRSVTRVNEALLEGTPIKMVCSATIGTDHIDLDYLKARQIAFANAPGCNANSVVEYVLAALFFLANKLRLRVSDLKIGIVGVGNIGGRLANRCQALGMTTLLNDPPLARKTGNPEFLPLNRLMEADIITLHVPLNRTGQDYTYHLFDKTRLQAMKPGSILINTSRGPVVNNNDLKDKILEGHFSAVVLDVWENEPNVDWELLKWITLGTPHIAGYSLEGKVKGTQMVYEAVCSHFGLPNKWDKLVSLPDPENSTISLPQNSGTLENRLHQIIRKVYDIEKDARQFRKVLELPLEQRAKEFDRLRKEYAIRREFNSYRIYCSGEDADLITKSLVLGFRRYDLK